MYKLTLTILHEKYKKFFIIITPDHSLKNHIPTLSASPVIKFKYY